MPRNRRVVLVLALVVLVLALVPVASSRTADVADLCRRLVDIEGTRLLGLIGKPSRPGNR